MAEYRQIYTRTWKDEWFSRLSTEEKLLFIYLFTNERASVSGIYELPLRFIAFESGIKEARVEQILAEFARAGKVFFADGVVWVVNLRKHNVSNSPKVRVRIDRDIAALPAGKIKEMYCKHHEIPYQYHNDTVSIPDQKLASEIDIEKEIEKEKDIDKDIERGAAEPLDPVSGLVVDILQTWKRLFPEKVQPKPKTIRAKVEARSKDSDFLTYWKDALERGAATRILHTEGWFDLSWFLKNEEHWQKVLNGWLDWKDREAGAPNGKANGNGKAPTYTPEQLEQMAKELGR